MKIYRVKIPVVEVEDEEVCPECDEPWEDCECEDDLEHGIHYPPHGNT
jgi:hypothetical protein